jgi:hypothetical protein
LDLFLLVSFLEKQKVEYSLGTDKKTNRPIAIEVTGPNGAQLVRLPPKVPKPSEPAAETKLEEPVPTKSDS